MQIKRHVCDGEVVNVKLHVSHLCHVVAVDAVVYLSLCVVVLVVNANQKTRLRW